MINNFITVLVIALTLSSCTNDTAFTIAKNKVGPLTATTPISELKALFENDSLVGANGNEEFTNAKGDILVFEKGGTKLLQLSPSSSERDTTVKFIQIFDPRYVTSKGIGINSTFKDIQDAYKIKRIDNLLGTIVIFVNDGDEYFTIDKKHLSANLMFDTDTTIEATQIPDEAPLKYFMIGW